MLKISNLNKAIFQNITAKISSLGISFIAVPISLSYLGQENYGIWVTILGIINWINFFDFGIEQGLRNKLGEAIAQSKNEKIKLLINSGYSSALLISVIGFVLTIPFVFMIDWVKLMNTNIVSGKIFTSTVFFLVIYIFISFILNIIRPINYANQRPQFVGFQNLLQQIIFLIGILFSGIFERVNILVFAHIYGVSMIFSAIIFNLHFFLKNKELVPEYISFDKVKKSGVLNLGLQFFIIQISILILQSTDNIIISKYISAEAVVPYAISFKLFSITQLIHGAIYLNSLRSSITNAYSGGSKESIKFLKDKVKLGFFVAILFNLTLYFSFDFIVNFWLSDSKIIIPTGLKHLMFIYSVIVAWNGTFIVFINALGKLKGQLIISIIQTIINIPLSIYIINYTELGSKGVLLATILCMIPMSIYVPIKYLKIS